MDNSVENGNQAKPGLKKAFGLKKILVIIKKYLFSLHKQIQKEDNYVWCLQSKACMLSGS